MTTHRGFTLIELVLIIVMLGMFTTVAVPNFMQWWIEEHNAAAQDVASNIAERSAANFAAKTAGDLSAATLNAANVCKAGLLAPFATSVTLVDVAPTTDQTYQIGGTGDCSTNAISVICTVRAFGPDMTAATTKVMCAR